LEALRAEDIASLVIARLARDTANQRGLPACRQAEEPTSIFIDVIRFETGYAIAEKLRFGTLQALRKVGAQDAPDAGVLGDLCYLAAAIGAHESIDVLPAIIRRPDSEHLTLWTGETIRCHALRALIGLLADSRCRSAEIKALLRELCLDPRYRVLALTGLIGLWPDEAHQYRSELYLS